jgi:hypothetical protein
MLKIRAYFTDRARKAHLMILPSSGTSTQGRCLPPPTSKSTRPSSSALIYANSCSGAIRWATEALYDQMLRLNRHERSGLFVTGLSAACCACPSCPAWALSWMKAKLKSASRFNPCPGILNP